MFDGWAAEDPVGVLVEKLTEAASENDVRLTSDGTSGPTPSHGLERATTVLVRLVRRLSAYDPRPLILGTRPVRRVVAAPRPSHRTGAA